jgi:hypothetical protein
MAPSLENPLLEDVWHELQKGNVYECNLRSEIWQMEGLQEGKNIYIDPRPAILETLLHELLHRLKPSWGEQRVTKEAHRLMVQMDETAKRQWWLAYKRIKKFRRPVEVED